MKVYLTGERERVGYHYLHVQPGNAFPDNTDWKDTEGTAIMFSIPFHNGVAEVADNLGQYLLDNELVKRSPLILPEGVN